MKPSHTDGDPAFNALANALDVLPPEHRPVLLDLVAAEYGHPELAAALSAATGVEIDTTMVGLTRRSAMVAWRTGAFDIALEDEAALDAMGHGLDRSRLMLALSKIRPVINFPRVGGKRNAP